MTSFARSAVFGVIAYLASIAATWVYLPESQPFEFAVEVSDLNAAAWFHYSANYVSIVETIGGTDGLTSGGVNLIALAGDPHFEFLYLFPIVSCVFFGVLASARSASRRSATLLPDGLCGGVQRVVWLLSAALEFVDHEAAADARPGLLALVVGHRDHPQRNHRAIGAAYWTPTVSRPMAIPREATNHGSTVAVSPSIVSTSVGNAQARPPKTATVVASTNRWIT